MNNKDIQTLIEREAENGIGVLHPLDKQSLSLDGKYYWENHFKKGFKSGASFALSLFKWRKVSEELPEKGKLKLDINNPCLILAKKQDGLFITMGLWEEN